MSDAPEELAEVVTEFALDRQHASVEASLSPVGDAA
jgi:hypothetical protein